MEQGTVQCCCGGKPYDHYRMEENYLTYYARRVFPSGMTAQIDFDLYLDRPNRKGAVECSFVIYHNRRQAWAVPNEITGRDGVEPLLWAKQQLFAFEEFLVTRRQYSRYAWTMEVGWSDEKRGRLYRRYLAKHGYTQRGKNLLIKNLTVPEKTLYCHP